VVFSFIKYRKPPKMSSEEEGSLFPRKRLRRSCPKIPYVFENKTIVYSCDHCMRLRDTRWLTWMCAGKRLGLSRDVARLIGDRLERSWVEWKDWFPVQEGIAWQIPIDRIGTLLSRFCCDVPNNKSKCVCNPEHHLAGAIWRLERKLNPEKPSIVCYVSSKYSTIEMCCTVHSL
jgi:hypothetical protein